MSNDVVTDSGKLPEYWGNLLATSGVVLVLVLTLFPYDFFFQEILSQFSFSYLRSRIQRPNDLDDLIANILLFIPVGLGIACYTQKLKLKAQTAFLLVLVSSFSLSLIVEVLQIFLPNRNPSYVDLIVNSAGGLVGFFCFEIFGIFLLRCLTTLVTIVKARLSTKILLLAIVVYVSLASLLSLKLQGKVELGNLSNWDSSYPLFLGNEATGERPWQGQIFDLCFSDRAASKKEITQILADKKSCQTTINSLIAAYVLTNQGDYQNFGENASDLLWQKENNNQQETSKTLIGSQWLKTKNAATLINEKIRDRSQFTLVTTLATDKLNQTGPARIISLSADPFHRNLTVGQWHNHLSLRLRTLLTKQNGTRPELAVANFFTDKKKHRLVIVYDSSLLSIYLDHWLHHYTLEISPETALFWSLSPRFSSTIHVNKFNNQFYQFLYYELILIPLAILVGLVLRNYSQTKFLAYLTIAVGMILTAIY